MKLAIITAVVLVCASPSASAHTRATHSMRPGQIRALVLNGTHRAGLAGRVSATLAKQGFRIQRLAKPWIANAPGPAAATTVYFDASQTNALAAAALLRVRLTPRAEVRASTKSVDRLALHAGRPLLIVVLGSSFQRVN